MNKKFGALLAYTPLLLAFLLMPTTVGRTSLDSGLYLKMAYQFIQGQVDWGFRPGFVLLLGSAFTILGPSVWSATVVIRVFYFLNVVLVFLVARYLYDKWTAFAAALALTTSYYLTFLSGRVLLDNIHPFFAILGIFLSILAVDRESKKLSVLAGLTLLYAYVIKSTTVIFLPFPVVYAALRIFPRWNIRSYAKSLIAVAIATCGIIIYHGLLLIVGEPTQPAHAIGRHGDDALGLILGNNALDTVQHVIAGIFSFWKEFLFQDFLLGSAFALAWAWVVVRATKHPPSRALCAVLALFTPAMAYLGLTSLRLGQAGILLFLTFIPLGVLVHDVCCIMANGAALVRIPRLTARKATVPLLVMIASVALSLYQVWFASSGRYSSDRWLSETVLARVAKGRDTGWTLRGSLAQVDKEAASVIKSHANDGDVVWTGYSTKYAIDFFSRYQYTVRRAPSEFTSVQTLGDDLSKRLPGGGNQGRLLFLWPNAWVSDLKHWNSRGELRLRYVDVPTLRKMCRDNSVVYVALDWRYRHIGRYLERMKGSERISQTPPVYKLKNCRPVKGFEPHVAHEIVMLLDELQELSPANYRTFMEEFIERYLGLPSEALAGNGDEAKSVVFMGLRNRSY